MNVPVAILFLAVGLVLLWKCADFLVAGAVGLAEQLGVSRLVVGLTVVAMGTSAPEVAASIAAVVRGIGDVAIGNVYGSNIANLALVGGVAALIRPTQVQAGTIRREIPVMIFVGLLLWPVLANEHLSRWEGTGLLVLFAGLIVGTIYLARREKVNGAGFAAKVGGKLAKGSGEMGKSVLLVVAGLVGLAGGADITVRGAVYIGRAVGLSEAVIGLTIVALGTSLPELATCIAASIKGHHDISVGNLVGSNIFNTLLVVGVAGTVKPFWIAQRLIGTDYWIMIGVSVGFAVLILLGRRVVGRIAGAILVSGYVVYMVYLFGYTAGK